MRRLKYSLSVKNDFADIAEYIATETGSRTLAEDFIGKLKARCRKLAQLPGTLGRSRDELAPGLRSVAHKSYIIFFRYVDDTVEIVAVLNGMRDIESLFVDET